MALAFALQLNFKKQLLGKKNTHSYVNKQLRLGVVLRACNSGALEVDAGKSQA